MTVLMDAGTFALSLAVVVALVYLLTLRLVDLNEEEPLWGLGLALVIGAVAGAALPLVVDSTVLELAAFKGALANTLTIFLALAIALALFEAISRLRGWSEVNGLMDGVVYGAAVGLGFATGGAFVRELRFADIGALLGIGRFSVLWTTLLVGLAAGVFGAIVGAGFGAAVQARTRELRLALPVAGLIAALLVHWLYVLLAGGTGGTSGLVRTWLALSLPVVALVVLGVFALTQERSAIAGELRDEIQSGGVGAEDLRLLGHPAARRSRYFALLRSGDLDGWAAMRALHNRQTQLALVKRRAARERDPDRRASADVEAERLRASAIELRRQLERVTAAARAREAAG